MVITGHQPFQHLNVFHISQRMAWLIYFLQAPETCLPLCERLGFKPKGCSWWAMVASRRICDTFRLWNWWVFTMAQSLGPRYSLKISHFPSLHNWFLLLWSLKQQWYVCLWWQSWIHGFMVMALSLPLPFLLYFLHHPHPFSTWDSKFGFNVGLRICLIAIELIFKKLKV